MKFNFEISKLALKDLDEIWEYSAEQWSKLQANRYYKEIIQVIREICNNSEIGKAIDYVRQGHRRINVKSHMIVYKIKKEIIYIEFGIRKWILKSFSKNRSVLLKYLKTKIQFGLLFVQQFFIFSSPFFKCTTSFHTRNIS